MDNKNPNTSQNKSPNALPSLIKALGFMLLLGSVTMVSCTSALMSI